MVLLMTFYFRVTRHVSKHMSGSETYVLWLISSCGVHEECPVSSLGLSHVMLRASQMTGDQYRRRGKL